MRDLYTRICISVRAIANADFELDLTPSLSVIEPSFDLTLMAAILNERMLKSAANSPNPFSYIS
jgi:hypothetical protein